jgi:hypothetical protein
MRSDSGAVALNGQQVAGIALSVRGATPVKLSALEHPSLEPQAIDVLITWDKR